MLDAEPLPLDQRQQRTMSRSGSVQGIRAFKWSEPGNRLLPARSRAPKASEQRLVRVQRRHDRDPVGRRQALRMDLRDSGA